MALIQCPECNQPISDKALKCPKCGFPIQDYLNGKIEEPKAEEVIVEEIVEEVVETEIPLEENAEIEENVSDSSHIVVVEAENDNQGDKKKKSKLVYIVSAIGAVVAIIAVVFGLKLLGSNVTVKSIELTKWKLIDSGSYSEKYEGTVTSEQKKPFVAVIGQYDDEEAIPKFVYVEDGKGTFSTIEYDEEDPSIKYRPIGYLGGSVVKTSDIEYAYTDSNYYDGSYSHYTSCDVDIEIKMNHGKDGILVFDVINETNEETDINMVATVVDGEAQIYYYAELPYKSRGIDISIVPKMFCESEKITEKDYIIEKEYKATRKDGDYTDSYSGEIVLSFENYPDGFLIFTEELKEGGMKENRKGIIPLRNFIHDGECIITTYDSVSAGEYIVTPKYEFNFIGYITWAPLEKESVKL